VHTVAFLMLEHFKLTIFVATVELRGVVSVGKILLERNFTHG